MDTKTVFVYLLDGLADWEIGFILAELNSKRFFKKNRPKYQIKTIALSVEPITTMGGLQITPDSTLINMDINDAAMLILPGSDLWLTQTNPEIIQIAQKFLNNGIPVAAICGATIALANNGFMNNCKHTSNNLDFLKVVAPNYSGESLYCEETAVTDNNLITASGIAPLEFAHHILKKLDVFSDKALENWYNLYKTQKPEYFLKLMGSLDNN